MNSRISFQTVNRHQLVDEIVHQLQAKITQGDLKPGDKIPTEPELMEQFGVGRSTIREAVRVLVSAGLLEKKQGFGTYLKAVTAIQEPLDQRLRRAEILEVYEVRRMLELEMAKLASERRDEEDLRLMRQLLDQRLKALEEGNMEAYLNADVQFHLAIAAASKNAVVIDLFRTFTTVLRDALDKLVKTSAVHDAHIDMHENLYESIKNRDADGAVRWTLENLESTVAELREALKQSDQAD